MTPFYEDPWLTVFQGDCREVMRSLEPESVHCVVTSPPYWGLRDYGQTDQLGLEATPGAYVDALVDVFAEVRRVLRDDGTVWLNLGDSYANDTKWGGSSGGKHAAALHGQTGIGRNKNHTGLKAKDLVGIPWRVAFALQEDGWYLRSDIIWSKPNPMPESVTDRPTKAHEYVFMLSKSARYFFDADAVREPLLPATIEREKAGYNHAFASQFQGSPTDKRHTNGKTVDNVSPAAGRNLRSVWTIATQPYPGAHFATFPRKLVEPCVKAGTSERGVCPECGAPWVRVVERGQPAKSGGGNTQGHADGPMDRNGHGQWDAGAIVTVRESVTTGWTSPCGHTTPSDYEDKAAVERAWIARNRVEPATVLDPFAGSGTTGVVAQSLNRRAILIDLNGDYLVQAMQRNRDIPLGLGAA